MKRTQKILLLILIFSVSLLPAKDFRIGVHIGLNEFLTQSRVWGQNDLFENHLGHYYFDEEGNSMQIGAQMFFGDHMAAILQYHTPRRGMSYFYSCAHEVINVPYDPSITVVRSYVSGISAMFRYYPFGSGSLSPYIGLGGELAILNAGDYVWGDIDDFTDWRLLKDNLFIDMGTKLLGGLILPAGVMISYNEHLYLDLSVNYTFLHIGQWDAAGDVPVEQSMGGLYLKVGAGYNL